MKRLIGFEVIIGLLAIFLLLVASPVSAEGIVDQEQWRSNATHTFDIAEKHVHKVWDQSIIAEKTGLLTNVEFEATIETNNVFFYIVDGGRYGGALTPVFYENLEPGEDEYNIDVSSAGLWLNNGDSFSIGFQSYYVGYEGDDGDATTNGSFSVWDSASDNAYPPGHLYYRYGGEGWLGLGYDQDMQFRTYLTPTPQCETVSEIPKSECAALVSLYNSTGGDSWKNNSVWLISNTPCSWYGIDCWNGHVTDLRLSSNQLTGSIPSELGNLANLKQLSFSSNQLTGSIPSELGNLANLKWLSLYFNQLTGSIPSQLGNLANLESLSLASNQLTGSIPPELGNLANLGYLYLQDNQLSGSIPSELGNLANLEALYLSSNQLTGSIPSQLGNLAILRGLYLDYNQLSGSIPSELGNLANLGTLYLSSNQLTGSIPPELGNLANLKWLDLYSNQLSGSIPSELGNLANLEALYLSSNQLSGSIPSELGNLANLEQLYLSSNQLSGSIPSELGNLANLETLYLSSNQLTGSIPPELGNLANLKWLDLYSNQLSGSIPVELMNMTSLYYLNICDNHLHTSDPDLRDFLSSLQPEWENCQKRPIPVPGMLLLLLGE